MLFGWVLSVGSRKISFLAAKPGQKDLEFIVKLVATGNIRPVIDSRYPLEKAADAMRYAAGGHARGKVVIHVD